MHGAAIAAAATDIRWQPSAVERKEWDDGMSLAETLFLSLSVSQTGSELPRLQVHERMNMHSPSRAAGAATTTLDDARRKGACTLHARIHAHTHTHTPVRVCTCYA